MELNHDFWAQMWNDNYIGFHQSEINSLLKKYWHKLDLRMNDHVLVPLCGKTRDMVWLFDQGHQVTGVEIVGKAIANFRRENPNYNAIEILHKDLLARESESLIPWEKCHGIFDRGSLVALSPTQRNRYYELLNQYKPKKILLSTVEYDQSLMAGPPHSVTKTEIMEKLGRNYSINLLEEQKHKRVFGRPGFEIELIYSTKGYLLKA